MDSLSNLLLKYHIPGVRAAENRRICVEEISALSGVPVTSKQVQYKNETLFLSVSPVLKSALYLKQVELKQKLLDRGVLIKSFK